METTEWICCPICRQKTRVKLREDTELKHFPLFCPKCKQEKLIDAKNFQVREVDQIYQKEKARR